MLIAFESKSWAWLRMIASLWFILLVRLSILINLGLAFNLLFLDLSDFCYLVLLVLIVLRCIMVMLCKIVFT